MGFNFRKVLSVIPGVKVNVTKNGVSSISIGARGAKINIGRKKVKTTLGIPGTGISYTKNFPYNDTKITKK